MTTRPNVVRKSLKSLSCLVGLLMGLTGCSHWIELAEPEELSQVRSSTAPGSRLSLVLDRVHIVRNGVRELRTQEAERQLLTILADSGRFSTQSDAGAARSHRQAGTIVARAQIEEFIDSHRGATAAKGALIGFSMFLLEPAIPLRYDYGLLATLELERWDGRTKRYHRHASGSVRFQLFGATPEMVDDLKGKVSEQALAGLARQIAADEDFLSIGPGSPGGRAVVEFEELRDRLAKLTARREARQRAAAEVSDACGRLPPLPGPGQLFALHRPDGGDQSPPGRSCSGSPPVAEP